MEKQQLRAQQRNELEPYLWKVGIYPPDLWNGQIICERIEDMLH
jgi:hypothetical protein